ncbi:MAG: NFACT family protein, partial [Candidatus Woesearchaeota archaeon]|nr:NFACT family protein [Candidatus Woesearchaeota archaeon]
MVSNVEVAVMVKELQNIIGNRVDNIYQDDEGLILQAHASGKGKLLIRINSHGAWQTVHKNDETTITGFCGQLRKYLRGKKIVSIKQENSERLIVFTIGKETLKLIVQLFGTTNVLLCDNMEILLGCSAEQQEGLYGKKIVRPVVHDLSMLTAEELEKPVENIFKTLIQLGLGKLYSTEACIRAKIDLESKKLSAKEAEQLLPIVLQLFTEPIKARIVRDGKRIIALPFFFQSLKEFPQEEKESFNQALDAVYAPTEQALQKARSGYEGQLRKLAGSIEKQEQLIMAHEKDMVSEQRKGELIYEHYPKLKKLLENFAIARKDHSFAE